MRFHPKTAGQSKKNSEASAVDTEAGEAETDRSEEPVEAVGASLTLKVVAGRWVSYAVGIALDRSTARVLKI